MSSPTPVLRPAEAMDACYEVTPPLAAAHPAVTPESHLLQDIGSYLKTYARERPDVAALWCFGIGFVVGWRLKPW